MRSAHKSAYGTTAAGRERETGGLHLTSRQPAYEGVDWDGLLGAATLGGKREALRHVRNASFSADRPGSRSASASPASWRLSNSATSTRPTRNRPGNGSADALRLFHPHPARTRARTCHRRRGDGADAPGETPSPADVVSPTVAGRAARASTTCPESGLSCQKRFQAASSSGRAGKSLGRKRLEALMSPAYRDAALAVNHS